MTISADTLKSDIWNTFRTLIVSNVTSVLIKGSGGANTKTVSIPSKNVASTFPDTVFDATSNYPLITISSPQFNTNPVTFRNRELSGTITFEVFANQSEAADKIIDLINYTIMNNETTLNTAGLEELDINSSDSNHYDRDKMSVHSRMLVWRYKYTW